MKSQTKECLMCWNPAFISWHFLSTSWELWKRKKGQHQMKGFFCLFFFMSSCSCLCLFRTSVFRFEWQENVAGTSARLRGIPTVFNISARPLCDGQLRNSVYTWRLLIYTGRRREQGTIQSPDSTSVFIFPPHAERRNKREPGRKRRKSCETNHSQAEECLIWTWTVKVQRGAKCVCLW